MRIVLQRVSRAKVTVEGEVVGEVGPGLLLLVGIRTGDTLKEAQWLVQKCLGLRIWPDETGKMDRSVMDIGGSVLAVSQFTLYGDASRGRRPDFMQAARPETAQPLFDAFVAGLKAEGVPVATGVFGAHMDVELVNDGPVTLIIDREAEAS
ncbi:D-tyrosyl-tRNA(Tyr) deacylase [compost metagenome]